MQKVRHGARKVEQDDVVDVVHVQSARRGVCAHQHAALLRHEPSVLGGSAVRGHLAVQTHVVDAALVQKVAEGAARLHRVAKDDDARLRLARTRLLEHVDNGHVLRIQQSGDGDVSQLQGAGKAVRAVGVQHRDALSRTHAPPVRGHNVVATPTQSSACAHRKILARNHDERRAGCGG
jgi:hypothetical protein